ncbi:MAG: hypothetical protein GWO20_06525 [Candidatus Korarchaeota archaeon]|nr:hypothetical protein [Candidatus Korarchaeota archaeon]NIU83100.1 hypothetical protein [Candidatus Thorarchaeota archaeon]NIW13478.1 hypothetical protein [Candidatus Thorarchaeota archaeon]
MGKNYLVKMRILVAGSGAIGSLVAAYLADNSELWLLFRPHPLRIELF